MSLVEPESSDKTFEVFYDGDCPLCEKEIRFLRWLDRKAQIQFTDISSPNFDALGYVGVDMDTLMAEIHGRMSGSLIKGVEVFRQLYGRTCFAFLVPITRWWGVRHGLDLCYEFFAKHRLKLTGRCHGKACSVSP